MILIPTSVALVSSHAAVANARSRAAAESYRETVHEVPLDHEDVSDEVLDDLLAAGEKTGHKAFVRGIKALIANRAGTKRASTGRWTGPEIMRMHLEEDNPEGWVIRAGSDGEQPWRVEAIEADKIHLCAYDLREHSRTRVTVEYDPTGLPETVLGRIGLRRFTAADRTQYRQDHAHLLELISQGEGHQIVVDGICTWRDQSRGYGNDRIVDTIRNQKMVVETLTRQQDRYTLDAHELAAQFDAPFDTGIPARLGNEPLIPLLLRITAFDLSRECDVSIDTRSARAYIYDPGVREKIVLPAAQHKIIDVLTRTTPSRLADIIHGKGEGNLILAKGEPGLGKTLTPEVVAEVLQRPLYVVDASSILDKSRGLRSTMAAVFGRVRRWDAVLLIDEADVVVGRRGNDLERNRITAELLRALESFERVAFLTTNRPDDIDPAIISRCVAIIEYLSPTGEDARTVWKVLGNQLQAGLVDDRMARTLAELFPAMAPRDIRQLLRLAIQVAHADETQVSVELIREVSVFRGHHTAEAA